VVIGARTVDRHSFGCSAIRLCTQVPQWVNPRLSDSERHPLCSDCCLSIALTSAGHALGHVMLSPLTHPAFVLVAMPSRTRGTIPARFKDGSVIDRLRRQQSTPRLHPGGSRTSGASRSEISRRSALSTTRWCHGRCSSDRSRTAALRQSAALGRFGDSQIVRIAKIAATPKKPNLALP
jgi:hypothetical protein